MTAAEVDVAIDRVSARRSELWANNGDPGEIVVLGRELVNLYEEKRHHVARDRSGRSRAEIVRQARVESELERLISR